MSDYLLDTSFLIELLNEMAEGKLGAARRFRQKMPLRARVFVSIASLAELLEGARDAASLQSEVARLADILGLSRQHAVKAALMQRRARSTGTRLGENDAWIAATATLAHLKLIGDDDAAFSERSGLDYANFRTGTP